MTEHEHESHPDDIGCLEAINGLYAYIDGEMNDPEAVARFERHLDHCRACYSRLELETALAEHIRKSAKSRASEGLHGRLRRLIDSL
jgi:anti-sigma factor (TIGR02949 family)